jgi:hypothetical protein
MRPTISIYIDRDQNNTRLRGGRLVGQFPVDNYTSLQTVGASIYEFARNNHIVNYGSYVIKFSGESKPNTDTRPTGIFPLRGIQYQENVEMLLPNDIYIPSYSDLTVNDLDQVLPESNLVNNIRVDIEPEFNGGLNKQFNHHTRGMTHGNLVYHNQMNVNTGRDRTGNIPVPM